MGRAPSPAAHCRLRRCRSGGTVDAVDSKSTGPCARGGSTPPSGTRCFHRIRPVSFKKFRLSRRVSRFRLRSCLLTMREQRSAAGHRPSLRATAFQSLPTARSRNSFASARISSGILTRSTSQCRGAVASTPILATVPSTEEGSRWFMKSPGMMKTS